MGRKIKNTHYDKPAHQRWLYELADIGLFKAIMVIFGVCIIAILGALLLVKVIVASFK